MKISCIFGVLFAVLSATSGYDIACIFPRTWGDNPFFGIASMSTFFVTFTKQYSPETPVVVRVGHYATLCRGMCLSLHDEDVLDPLDMQPSFVTVPEFGQNAYSTLLCIPQCVLHALDGFYDFTEQSMAYHYDNYDIETVHPNSRSDIYNAFVQKEVFNNLQPMMDILEAEDYHPITMGSVAGIKLRYYADRDGWNANGETTYDRETGMEVPCTGSCRHYQDTIGYEPVVDPRIHTEYSTDNNKYECTGNCRRWQPLQEGDSGGSMKRQEFTMAHAGVKGHTYVRDVQIMLEDPEYDLYQESLLLIDRLRETTTDQYKQDAIDRFDNKLNVRSIISNGIRDKFASTGIHAFQDEILFKVGLSTAEYDGAVQAWAEKAYHDLVRPTTVIKHWGDDDLYTFGGDRDVMGPVAIKARDFEAYIRVMPHAEYPSGSSCLCTTYYEFADTFMMNRYNDTLSDLVWDIGGREYILENMEELRDVCGESRLWGGMHYTAAIEGGNQACTGLGQLAYEYTTALKNGSTFEGGRGPWYWGDSLGVCEDNTPTMSPSPTSMKECMDSPLLNSFNNLGCSFLTQSPGNTVHCSLPGAGSHCPLSCDVCDEYLCEDSEVGFLVEGDFYTCAALASLDDDEVATYCSIPGVEMTCRATCGYCM